MVANCLISDFSVLDLTSSNHPKIDRRCYFASISLFFGILFYFSFTSIWYKPQQKQRDNMICSHTVNSKKRVSVLVIKCVCFFLLMISTTYWFQFICIINRLHIFLNNKSEKYITVDNILLTSLLWIVCIYFWMWNIFITHANIA